MRRALELTEEHELFRASVRQFAEREVAPRHEEFERAGIVDREVFAHAGAAGFLGIDIPAELGGGGVRDFRYNAIVGEELQRVGAAGASAGLTLHNDVCTPYFLRLATPEQQQRWFPGIASGALITAIAMTEPGIGSDLASMSTTAMRDGEHYVVNGAKTFITNGINADLVIAAVKTDPGQRHRGMSLLVIERGMEGFARGRNLDKLGMHSQDTAELFFTDVRVPVANRLGEEGAGFSYLVQNLPQERLSIAVAAISASEAAFGWTLDYVKERRAFGQPIGSFQYNRFRMAELATQIAVTRTFVDHCIALLNADELSAQDAAMAKWWATDIQGQVMDAGVQMFGGYGYMNEYPITRAFADSRVSRIYGGTNEIMKEIIGRGLGL